MSDRTCLNCGYRLLEEQWCYVETIPEYRDKVGRHMGRCWDGTFPKSEPPELTEEEIEGARERGAARFGEQLTLDVAA